MDAHNHEQLVAALRLIGVVCEVPPGADWPVFEDDYMKFMGGPDFDKRAADCFEAWLIGRGFTYERHRDRAIRSIDPLAVDLILRMWRMDPETGEPVGSVMTPDEAAALVSVPRPASAEPDAAGSGTVWSDEQQQRAFSQGWGIFDNDDYGLRIEKYDESGSFASDAEAVAFVGHRAACGCVLERQALAHLAAHHGVAS